jgi:hypothetical protein
VIHPQEAELRAKLEKFLAEDDSILTVHDPDSSQTLDFYHMKGIRSERAVMRYVIGTPLVVPERCSVRIPKPHPWEIHNHFGPNRGKITIVWIYIWVVRNAAEMAKTAVRFLIELRGVAPKAWLWITDIEQQDSWPRPLPKPSQWPPE